MGVSHVASPGIGFLSFASRFRKVASYLSGPRRVAPSFAQSTPAIVGSSLSSLSLSLDWSFASSSYLRSQASALSGSTVVFWSSSLFTYLTRSLHCYFKKSLVLLVIIVFSITTFV